MSIEGKDDIVVESPLFVGNHHPVHGPEGRNNFLLGRMWNNIAIADEVSHSRYQDGNRSSYTESINGDFMDNRFYRNITEPWMTKVFISTSKLKNLLFRVEIEIKKSLIQLMSSNWGGRKKRQTERQVLRWKYKMIPRCGQANLFTLKFYEDTKQIFLLTEGNVQDSLNVLFQKKKMVAYLKKIVTVIQWF